MNKANPIWTPGEKHASKTHPWANKMKIVLMAGFVALLGLSLSPAWAGDFSHEKTVSGPIHLTSLSIQIGPGGFHLGIGAPFYGRAYSRPHIHVAPRHYWNSSRYSHRGHKHYSSPKRFNRGHGWKNDGPRGNFRGQGKGGWKGRGHRGGRW